MTMASASLVERAHDGVVSDPDEIDPAARPRRRSFTAGYKARIVDEYDALPSGSPQRGALLRREGLYSSRISEWRRARDNAGRDGLGPKARKRRSAEQVELEKLRRRNERLESELAKTKLALEITGKAHELLGMLSESEDTDPRSKP